MMNDPVWSCSSTTVELQSPNAAVGSGTHNQKTPISVLQEVCSRSKLTPEYKLVSVDGAVHAPTFLYRVEVGEVSAVAPGQSKKKAKHCAAKALIEKIIDEDLESLVTLRPHLLEAMVGMTDGLGEKETTGSSLKGDGETLFVGSDAGGESCDEFDSIPGNPVGQLQELCMKKRWRPPDYDTQVEEGLPHERTFGIMCLVNNYSELGFGRSKKLAKRQAAHKMIQLIEKLESSESDEITDDNIASLKEEIRETQLISTVPIPTITAKHSQQVSTILKQLKASDGPKLKDLQFKQLDCTTAGINYIGLLREIADEQKFDVTYIAAETVEGQATCLCHLTTLPLAVCFGIGETEELAKMNASHNALQYLKIMTKRK